MVTDRNSLTIKLDQATGLGLENMNADAKMQYVLQLLTSEYTGKRIHCETLNSVQKPDAEYIQALKNVGTGAVAQPGSSGPSVLPSHPSTPGSANPGTNPAGIMARPPAAVQGHPFPPPAGVVPVTPPPVAPVAAVPVPKL